MKINKWLNLILPTLSIFAVVAVWTVASVITDSEYILPSVWQTAIELFGLFGLGEFYIALLMTFLRALIAFLISFILAFALALLAHKSDKADRLIAPVISIIRALPTIAIVLLLLFWTNSNVAPVVVTMLVVLPTTYTGARNALDGVDKDVLEMCKVFNVDKKRIFLNVQLPQVFPPLLKLIGSGLSLNLKLMVAAEVLSATVRSIGNMLNFASYNGEMAQMLAIVAVVVVIGVVIEGLFNYLSRKAGAWK